MASARKPPQKESLAMMERRWIREIRTHAREWGRIYTPKQDMTPMEDVRGALYAHILTNHPDDIGIVFKNPIYAPVCTWHIIGRDVKKSLEDRGYIIVPNLLDDPRNPFNGVRDVMIRQSTEKDAKEYIALEHDLLGPLVDRVERLVKNSESRLEQITARRKLLASWLKVATT